MRVVELQIGPMTVANSTFKEWLERRNIDPALLKPEEFAVYHGAYETAMAAVPVDVLPERFIEYGVQYYVAGRCAVATGLNPVAANIIHHAIEMFLKAGLCDYMDEKQRRDLGHELPRLMSEFKAHYDTENKLARFDTCLQELQKYEDIRYPDGMMGPGAITMRLQFAGAPMVKGPEVPGSKEFNLDLGEIDALMRAIYEAAKFREIFFLHTLTTHYREPGKTYLLKENAEASLFEPGSS